MRSSILTYGIDAEANYHNENENPWFLGNRDFLQKQGVYLLLINNIMRL